MRPIFHLSFPVRDLEEAISFYTRRLGAEIGRQNDFCADALLFGAQVTLQNDPSTVSNPMPRTRHFGATLPWDEWESLTARLLGVSVVVEPPTISYEGQPIEQGKMMIADPSGNLIEIKAYRHPDQVLGSLAG
jgi:extradiol dioxygenase family protein